ncbi:hypothetical protein BFL35_04830 [Clavibacter michiganensis]|nr:hypothetical protein BFL35_04830 [Clavibacter michiganensis]
MLTDASQRLGDTFSSVPDPALLAMTPAHVLEAAGSLDGHRVIRPLTGEPRDGSGAKWGSPQGAPGNSVRT